MGPTIDASAGRPGRQLRDDLRDGFADFARIAFLPADDSRALATENELVGVGVHKIEDQRPLGGTWLMST